MSPETVGLIGIVVLLFLMFVGMPLGFCMIAVGFVGYVAIAGFNSAFYNMGIVSYNTLANFNMVALPLFMLMGLLAVEVRISGDLYRAAYNWIGQLRGGLAMATVLACTAIGAITSEEISTASAMGKVAYPEMRKYHYGESLAAACIAAGGTTAALIPPSVGMIWYGILTQQSIGRLFMAGILPGLLQTVIYLATIYILCLRNKQLGPPGPKTSFKQKVASLKLTGPVLIIFLVVMGGIYMGVFTATEAGAIGAFSIFILGFILRRISRQGIISTFTETGRIIAMVGVLIVGSMIFSSFMAVSRLPFTLADFIAGLQVNSWFILVGLLIFYIFLGFFLGLMPVLILTLPIIFPIIQAMGFDPIWYGILMVMMIEVGTITPPVAMVCFVLSGVIKIPVGTIFRGIWPFIGAESLVVVLLVVFPQISIWLPNMMKGT